MLWYSSSNSWRSTLTSPSSRASSFILRYSSHEKSTTDEASGTYDMGNVSYRPSHDHIVHQMRIFDMSKPAENGPAPFSEEAITIAEEEIWNELVDEGNLEPSFKSVPEYRDVSLLNRPCCESPPDLQDDYNTFCEQCGFTSMHRCALKLGMMRYDIPEFVFSKADFSGNTPLHCAAAFVGKNDLRKIKYIVQHASNVGIVNNFGETFLHVLCKRGPPILHDIKPFIAILKEVSSSSSRPGFTFPFSRPDYHGRTILHTLFQHSRHHTYAVPSLSQIFSVMKPDLAIPDNSGRTILNYLEEAAKRIPGTKYNQDLQNLVAPLTRNPPYATHFNPHRLGASNRTLFNSWLERRREPGYIRRIDIAGDTPLISLLKHWRIDWRTTNDLSYLPDIVEHMVSSGAMIHIRDRNGDTALAIAARKGFRPVVTFLLEKGANVHIRNYRGEGILSQSEESLALAGVAYGEGRLWGMIWSCRNDLIDAGARANPSEQDEWMSSSSRRLVAQSRFVARVLPDAAPQPVPNPLPRDLHTVL